MKILYRMQSKNSLSNLIPKYKTKKALEKSRVFLLYNSNSVRNTFEIIYFRGSASTTKA